MSTIYELEMKKGNEKAFVEINEWCGEYSLDASFCIKCGDRSFKFYYGGEEEPFSSFEECEKYSQKLLKKMLSPF